jgi:hypothetical protein
MPRYARLPAQPRSARVASVCTGALLLGAAGRFDLPRRRNPAGSETTAPLATRPPTKVLARESPPLTDRAAGRIGHRITRGLPSPAGIASPSAVSRSSVRPAGTGAGVSPTEGLGSHNRQGVPGLQKLLNSSSACEKVGATLRGT